MAHHIPYVCCDFFESRLSLINPAGSFYFSHQETAFLNNCRRTASIVSNDPVQLLVIGKEVNLIISV